VRCKKPRYTEEHLYIITRLFNKNKTDREIASVMREKYNRQCQWEAIRKIRRKIGLKKVPTFNRWEWKPPLFQGSDTYY
jgi:hypothetical protein